MRLVRRNCMLLIYVKARELKLPIVVPLPLALVDELLRAVVAITWLIPVHRGSRRWQNSATRQKLLKKANRNLRYIDQLEQNLLEPLQLVFPYVGSIEPWRIVATARHLVKEVRAAGSFSIVDVETPNARVQIRLL